MRIEEADEFILLLAIAAVGLATTSLGTFFALRRSEAPEWLRGVRQTEHLERLCPQNLHLRSLLNTITFEPAGLLFGLLGLFDLVGDIFVVFGFVKIGQRFKRLVVLCG
jgi:hypothetical protein